MQVFVIANCGIEHYSIRHICAREDTARRLFEEVRKELLAEAIRMQKFCRKREIEKHRHRGGLYDSIVELLGNTTFYKQLSSSHDHVVCTEYKLEE